MDEAGENQASQRYLGRISKYRGFTDEDICILWTAMVHKFHAINYELSEDQFQKAREIFSELTAIMEIIDSKSVSDFYKTRYGLKRWK